MGFFVLFFLFRTPFWYSEERLHSREALVFDWTCYSSTSPFLHLITLFLCLFSLMNHLVTLVLKFTQFVFVFSATEFLGHSSSVHSVSSDAFSGHSLYHLFLIRPKGILSIVPHACIMCVPWTRTHNTVGKSINSLGHWVMEQWALSLWFFWSSQFHYCKNHIHFFLVCFQIFFSFFAIFATEYELTAFHAHVIKIIITNIQSAYSMSGHVFIYID